MKPPERPYTPNEKMCLWIFALLLIAYPFAWIPLLVRLCQVIMLRISLRGIARKKRSEAQMKLDADQHKEDEKNRYALLVEQERTKREKAKLDAAAEAKEAEARKPRPPPPPSRKELRDLYIKEHEEIVLQIQKMSIDEDTKTGLLNMQVDALTRKLENLV